MNIQKKLLRSVIFSCSILFWASVVPVKTQEGFEVRRPIKQVVQNRQLPTTTGSRGIRNQKVKVFVPVTVVKTKIRIVKTSNLTVSTEPGAEVSLQPFAKGITIKTSTADREGRVVFEDLKPITYKITASLDGFEGKEQDVVKILPQKTFAMNLELKPITYELNLDTNIKEGEIRYAPAALISEDAQGLKTRETGGYCMEPIKNGKAVIKELKKGYYNIDIRPSFNEIEYEPILTAINVPNEILNKDESNRQQSYQIELDKKVSTETFASAWTNDNWILPPGWKLSNGMKTNGLSGFALPRNEQYRYYTNFEMISDVKSFDGKSVGFVVRARDAQNYYLIQISGKNAVEPYVIKGYTVKKGIPVPFLSIPIPHFKSTIAAKKSFRVIIKGKENAFEVFIRDSETGDELPLGKPIIDRDNDFRKGAVGILGDENSNFEVAFFMVCNSSCP